MFLNSSHYEVSVLDVLPRDAGEDDAEPRVWPASPLGWVLMGLALVLAVGNLVLCLRTGWAFSGLVFPAVFLAGLGAVLVCVAPMEPIDAGELDSNTVDVDVAGVDDSGRSAA